MKLNLQPFVSQSTILMVYPLVIYYWIYGPFSHFPGTNFYPDNPAVSKKNVCPHHRWEWFLPPTHSHLKSTFTFQINLKSTPDPNLVALTTPFPSSHTSLKVLFSFSYHPSAKKERVTYRRLWPHRTNPPPNHLSHHSFPSPFVRAICLLSWLGISQIWPIDLQEFCGNYFRRMKNGWWGCCGKGQWQAYFIFWEWTSSVVYFFTS